MRLMAHEVNMSTIRGWAVRQQRKNGIWDVVVDEDGRLNNIDLRMEATGRRASPDVEIGDADTIMFFWEPAPGRRGTKEETILTTRGETCAFYSNGLGFNKEAIDPVAGPRQKKPAHLLHLPEHAVEVDLGQPVGRDAYEERTITLRSGCTNEATRKLKIIHLPPEIEPPPLEPTQ